MPVRCNRRLPQHIDGKAHIVKFADVEGVVLACRFGFIHPVYHIGSFAVKGVERGFDAFLPELSADFEHRCPFGMQVSVALLYGIADIQVCVSRHSERFVPREA